MSLIDKNVGPYTGIAFDRVLHGRWRLIVYQAFNACGLIGCECNGIAVLDEKEKAVVLDEHEKQASGWYGPSVRQMLEAERLAALPSFEFEAWLGQHPRVRPQYWVEPLPRPEPDPIDAAERLERDQFSEAPWNRGRWN